MEGFEQVTVVRKQSASHPLIHTTNNIQTIVSRFCDILPQSIICKQMLGFNLMDPNAWGTFLVALTLQEAQHITTAEHFDEFVRNNPQDVLMVSHLGKEQACFIKYYIATPTVYYQSTVALCAGPLNPHETFVCNNVRPKMRQAKLGGRLANAKKAVMSFVGDIMEHISVMEEEDGCHYGTLYIVFTVAEAAAIQTVDDFIAHLSRNDGANYELIKSTGVFDAKRHTVVVWFVVDDTTEPKTMTLELETTR